jgi:hypothetical protein
MSLKPPNIPRLSSSVPAEVQRAFDALKTYFQQAAQAGGLATAEAVSKEITAIDFALDTTTPSQVEGLVVTGLFNKIMLEWTAVSASVQIEIHRSETDDLGAAVQVGQCPSSQSMFVDAVPDSDLGKTYYYWIRANNNGSYGPWNQTAGTPGSTADDPEYLLQLAAQKWQASYAYALGSLSMPTVPNGYCYEVTVDNGSSGSTEPVWPTTIDATVNDGDLTWKCKAAFSFETFFKLALVNDVPRLTLNELFLADAIIKRAMIEDLAVDSGKIANLTVSKLLAGVIEAAGIYVGSSQRIHIDGTNQKITISDGTRDRVILGNLGSGWGIEIYDASGDVILDSGGVSADMVSGLGAFALVDQISAANISTYMASAAIGEAYLGEASVGTLKIQENAVTVPVHSSYDGAGYIGTDYTELLRGTIDSEGQPIHVLFTCHCDNYAAASTSTNTVYLEVLLDGVSQKSGIKVSHVPGNTRNAGVAVLLYQIDGVSSGNRVVTIKGKKSQENSNAFAEISYKSMLLQGIKR